MMRTIFLSVFVLGFVLLTEANQITSNGQFVNWSDPGSWVGGVVPGNDDTAIIVAQDAIFVNVTDTVARIELLTNAGGFGSQITYLIFSSDDIHLHVTGDVVLNGSGSKRSELYMADGIITGRTLLVIEGNLVYNSSSTGLFFDLSGFGGSGNEPGELELRGSIIGTPMITQSTESTIIFGGTSTITIPTSTIVYNHLRITNTSTQGAVLNGTIDASEITGNITVMNGGTLSNGGFNITGNSGDTFQINSGGTYRLLGTTSNMPSGFSVNTIDANATLEFGGTNGQNINGGSYPNLTISGTGTKTMGGNIDINGTFTATESELDATTSNYDINVSGSLVTVLGTINQRTGAKLIMDGSTSQSISGNTSIDRLEIANTSGGVSITAGGGNTLTINDSLDLQSGTLTTNDNLTIASTASGTGRILPNGGSISGNVTMQRFVPGSTGDWHLMGSPVSGVMVSDYTSQLTMFGIPGAPNITVSASMYLYDETLTSASDPDTGWVLPSATTTGLNPGEGQIIFIDPTDMPATVAFSGTVTLTTHTFAGISYTSSGDALNDGWNLVANPFPFPIDWDAGSGWTRSNISADMHYYDPSIDDYRGYSTSTGSVNGGSQHIPTNQGFWVQATGAPTMSATTAVITSSSPDFNRTIASEKELIKLSISNPYNPEYAPEISFHFIHDASKDKDSKYDAYKLRSLASSNTPPYFASISADSVKLANNAYPSLTEAYEIPIYLEVTKTDTYTIHLTELSNGILNMCEASLIDVPTGNKIDLMSQDSYTFVQDSTGKTGVYRFMLAVNPIFVDASFTQDRDTVLLSNLQPVTFISTVTSEDTITWEANNQSILNEDTVQFNFAEVGVHTVTLTVGGNCGSSKTTTITVVDDTTNLYSSIFNPNQRINVYPNPAKHIIQINMGDHTINNTYLQLYNLLGEKVLDQGIHQNTEQISVAGLPAGNYFVSIVSNHQKIYQGKLLIQE